MNAEASGCLAIVIFGVLLLFFLSAVAAAPAASPLTSNSAAGTPFVLPVSTVSPSTSLGAIGTVPAVSAQVAPVPLATPVSSTAVEGGTLYTIQSGEWLQQIAERYNTTVNAILAINPQITDPSVVTPGQQIQLPVGSGQTP